MGPRLYSEGFIANQSQLLQEIIDGLDVYNTTQDPLIAMFCREMVRETARVPQGPLGFDEEGEGANPDAKKMQFRLLSFPLRTFDLSTPFTRTGLEDSLPSDIQDTFNAAMAGASERDLFGLINALFVKRTAGAIGTAYQAGFWNGETDAPPYGNFANTGAISHYVGLNTTTLATGHITAAVEQLNKFGFAKNLASVVALFSTDQQSDVEAMMDNSSTMFGTPQRVQAVDNGVLSGVKVGGVQCVFHSYVPSGYFGVFDISQKIVGRRVHLDPRYRGLRMYGPNIADPNEPLVDSYFRMRMGYAVRQLGAGALRQIVASPTYTNPTLRYS